MPTLADIEDLRGALERGIAAGLNLDIDSYTRQNAALFQKATPRFEIAVTIGAATGQRRAFPENVPPLTRLCRWNFTVKFDVITRPQENATQNEGESDADFQARLAANNNLHAQIVSRVRGYASTAAQNSWADVVNFPYHFMDERLRDASSPSSLKPQEAIEQTTLSFYGFVGVRESAWQQLAN